MPCSVKNIVEVFLFRKKLITGTLGSLIVILSCHKLIRIKFKDDVMMSRVNYMPTFLIFMHEKYNCCDFLFQTWRDENDPLYRAILNYFHGLDFRGSIEQ